VSVSHRPHREDPAAACHGAAPELIRNRRIAGGLPDVDTAVRVIRLARAIHRFVTFAASLATNASDRGLPERRRHPFGRFLLLAGDRIAHGAGMGRMHEALLTAAFLTSADALAASAPSDQRFLALHSTINGDKNSAHAAGHQSDRRSKEDARARVTKPEWQLLVRKAQIWMPTNVSEMDIRVGPPSRDAFLPNEMVTCDYVDKKLPGSSRKFYCRLENGDVVKVRYGTENPEVEGSVLATRLLWALGFGADRVYPVRVSCHGCSTDPFTIRHRVKGTELFDPAAIERKPPGQELKASGHPGWAWPELDSVDEADGGAPQKQRDALKLLAVLLQHTDSRAEQQRLLCLPGGITETGECDRPFLILHDVGLTFGHANYFIRSRAAGVNFEDWSKTPVWRDARACVGHLSESVSGTLADPVISEAGRKFLSELLIQLTDQQLSDLFEVARVNLRSRRPGSSEPAASVEEWVKAFKSKRDQVMTKHCPS